MKRVRLRWLGPALLVVGLAASGVAIWYVVHARPHAGAVIDSFQVDANTQLVVRAEQGGDRSFLELDRDGSTVWQALIPHYIGEKGRPAIAWNDVAVTVRVHRGGKAEVFALAMQDAAKLGGFRLAPEHEPITTLPKGPITVTDHIRSYEIVGGEKWHQLVAIELRTGKALWKAELGHWEVQDAGVQTPYVWVIQAGQKRYYNMLDGNEDRSLN
ncbi:MAG: hypothetical protein ABI467_22090 [Kofleriaceae bacterium]